MKRSAGIIPYKIIDDKVYIYLEHPGGPYWKGINKWSICKGEYKKGIETSKEAAVREFKEESGTDIDIEKLEYLSSHKISNKKLAIIFTANQDIDSSKMKSNTFFLESPKGSGNIVEYPEMDEAKWFLIDECYGIIFDNQRFFLGRLKEKIGGKNEK